MDVTCVADGQSLPAPFSSIDCDAAAAGEPGAPTVGFDQPAPLAGVAPPLRCSEMKVEAAPLVARAASGIAMPFSRASFSIKTT